jgi:hypothetical protein
VRLLVAAGAAATVASVFVPWVFGRGLSNSYSFVPIRSTWTIPLAVVMCSGVLVGLVRLRAGTSVAVLGITAGAWSLVSLGVWVVAARIMALLPIDWLPDDSVVRVGPGATLGLAGGVMMLTGVVADLTGRTWRVELPVVVGWVQPVLWTLAIATLAVRQLPWIVVRTDVGVEWSLPIDVVPVLGDVLVISSVVLAAALLVVGLVPGRMPLLVAGVMAVVTGVSALLALVLQWVGGRLIETVADRLPGGPYGTVDVSAGSGSPTLAAVAGAALIAVVVRRRVGGSAAGRSASIAPPVSSAPSPPPPSAPF